MQLVRTVESTHTPDEVFAYLADFATTTEWEPGTVETVRLSGDGGLGTTYRNTSRFLGRETELVYEVTEHTVPTRVVLRGENDTVISLGHDRGRRPGRRLPGHLHGRLHLQGRRQGRRSPAHPGPEEAR